MQIHEMYTLSNRLGEVDLTLVAEVTSGEAGHVVAAEVEGVEGLAEVVVDTIVQILVFHVK